MFSSFFFCCVCVVVFVSFLHFVFSRAHVSRNAQLPSHDFFPSFHTHTHTHVHSYNVPNGCFSFPMIVFPCLFLLLLFLSIFAGQRIQSCYGSSHHQLWCHALIQSSCFCALRFLRLFASFSFFFSLFTSIYVSLSFAVSADAGVRLLHLRFDMTTQSDSSANVKSKLDFQRAETGRRAAPTPALA